METYRDQRYVQFYDPPALRLWLCILNKMWLRNSRIHDCDFAYTRVYPSPTMDGPHSGLQVGKYTVPDEQAAWNDPLQFFLWPPFC